MAYLDTTTGANFIPELWAEPIFKFYERKLKTAFGNSNVNCIFSIIFL